MLLLLTELWAPTVIPAEKYRLQYGDLEVLYTPSESQSTIPLRPAAGRPGTRLVEHRTTTAQRPSPLHGQCMLLCSQKAGLLRTANLAVVYQPEVNPSWTEQVSRPHFASPCACPVATKSVALCPLPKVVAQWFRDSSAGLPLGVLRPPSSDQHTRLGRYSK